MSLELRLSDPSLIDELAAACRRVGLDARRQGDAVVVNPPEPSAEEPAQQARMELLFFARAWALDHAGVEVELRNG